MIFHAIKAGGVDTLIERYTRAARGAGNRGQAIWSAEEDPQMNCPSWLRIRRLETASDREIEGLSDVLRDCVEGGASVGFMLPLTRGKAEAFWRGASASAARGERVVLVAEEQAGAIVGTRSEEHTSELQSRPHLVCRLLLEKKNKTALHRRQLEPADTERAQSVHA